MVAGQRAGDVLALLSFVGLCCTEVKCETSVKGWCFMVCRAEGSGQVPKGDGE